MPPVSAGDNIAKFLMSAHDGERGQVRMKDGRYVTVTAGPAYTSALGLACRRGSVQNGRGEALVSAACLKDQVWHTVITP